MSLVQRLLFLFAFGVGLLPTHAATTARLALSHEIARPGETVWAGIHLRMPPKWHTYWQNGGDSGAATTARWTLPAGWAPGEILWPTPEKHSSAGLITYVYYNEVVLLVPITVGQDTSAGAQEIQAKVSWLECADVCIPGGTNLAGRLTIGTASKPSADAPLIETWKGKLPLPKPASFAGAWWENDTDTNESRALIIEWPPGIPVKEADFYPYASTNAIVQTATEPVATDAGKIRLRKVVEKLEGNWPTEVAGLLIEKGEGGVLLAAHDVSLPLAKPPEGASGPANVNVGIGVEKKPLLVWLGLAFLGGMILNLMPCVLPVIALKIFGFVNQARETPARVRHLGLIYGLGVVFSFLVLAGFVIGLKSVGKQVSWGMQFGDARFLVVMTTLATLVALNLFGLFEVNLGGGAMGAASELASREGASGAFFNGILATALATPCTAPALASALGFAFSQPPAIVALIFATVGLGLAAPYVVLSFQPAWLKFLPKPGAWMEKFKIAMGFPMLATAIWLLNLTIEHYGDVLWLGFFLVFLSLAAWVFGQFVQRGQSRRGLAVAITLGLLAIGYGYGLEKELRWRTPVPPKAFAAGDEEIIQDSPDGIAWRRWSPAAIEKARTAGRPVFVDFTAKWCATCQLNKKTSIEIDSVRAKLKEINALTLRGDYTRTPPEITTELERFGRAGVPLVLVYPRDASKPPQILPELLTPSIVLDALEAAAK